MKKRLIALICATSILCTLLLPVKSLTPPWCGRCEQNNMSFYCNKCTQGRCRRNCCGCGLPPVCRTCSLCTFENPFPYQPLGYILCNKTITIFDALEILKHLVEMESVISKCSTIRRASLIVSDGDYPTIFDALEILKYLAGMESAVSE